MINDKLYINGVQVDLEQSQPVSLTFSQAGISDPSKRLRSFSKTFNLAGTQRNIQFFKEFYMLSWSRNDNISTSASFNPSVNLPCKYYKGEHLRFEGYIKLLDISILKGKVSFSVNMYSDTATLFQKWDDLKLSDLDFSMYNHPLNESHIRESWNNQVKVNGVFTSNFTGSNPDGWGYIYGLVDYGLSSNQTDYIDNQLYPLFYMRELFIKSFEYLGYTIDGDFIDSQDFKDLIFGWGGGTNPSLPSTLVSNLELDADFDADYSNTANSQIVNNPIFGSQVQSISNYKVLNLLDTENSFAETVNQDNLNQLSGGTITVGATATYSLTVQFTADVSNIATTDATLNGQTISIILYLVKGNGKVNLGQFNYNGSTTTTWNFIKTIELNLSSNDDYYFQFEIVSSASISGAGTNGSLTTSFDLNNTFNILSVCTASEVVTNSIVHLSNYLPDMKVVDFVKGVITQHNLYLSDPSNDNVITIEPMPDYYTDNSISDDWTNKQDISKVTKITPIATKQPTALNFKYKEDKDFYRDDYFNQTGKHFGNYTHDNNLSYGTSEQNYTLSWTLSPLVELNNGLFIPRIIKVDNGVVKTFKGSPRLYVYGGMKSGNFNILDNGGTPIAETSYPVLSNLDSISSPTKDICFETPEIVYYTTTSYTTNTAFKRFYSLMVNELNSIDSKMLTAYFRLNQGDVSRGFMRTLKRIDGVLYRFNLLSDYNINKDDSYKVELVKVIEAKSVGSAVVPFTPAVVSIDTTNGNDVESSSKSITLNENSKLVVIDSAEATTTSLDVSKLPINKEFTVFKKGSGNVTIESLGSELINGESDLVLTEENEFKKLIWTGVEFLIIG